MWEPEGLPQPTQLGRVIANDQVYMGNANVGSVQIGGPYDAKGPAKDTASRRAIYVCQPPKAVCRTARLRRDDSLENGQAGVPASRDEGGHGYAAGVLR